MIILGINGGFRQGYQDVSAVIIRDGEVLFAIEEERLSRVKFSSGRLPYLSVLAALDYCKLSIKDIDLIAFHGSTWDAEIDKRLADYFKYHFEYNGQIVRYHHHDCHAAGSYFSSGYDKALILTLDNSGDGVSVQVSIGEGDKINTIKRYERPNSLGLFYSLISQYCGFIKDSDEYKLMGLAAYGDKSKFDFSWLSNFENGDLVMNMDYIVVPAPKSPSLHRDEMNFNEKFIQKMGVGRRIPSAAILQFYKDVAASAQSHLEQTALAILEYYVKQTGIKKICLSGGVALNCLMNQKIMDSGFIDSVFIQPASSDAGISMGAAWLAGVDKGIKPIAPQNAFLGTEYSDTEIEKALSICQVRYEKVADPALFAAEDIASGKVVGWFQGRMEFGPRALGNRSILANATIKDIQGIVNKKIKFRETFRPFGASVLESDLPLYFSGKLAKAPYMTLVYDVQEDAKGKIPGVVHQDGTCRIQTIGEKDNELYYQLLKYLKEQTGYGLVLNTSFNLNYEPIVESPRQAIASFFASGIDVLYLNGFRVSK